jgi:hypothetical protein
VQVKKPAPSVLLAQAMVLMMPQPGPLIWMQSRSDYDPLLTILKYEINEQPLENLSTLTHLKGFLFSWSRENPPVSDFPIGTSPVNI